MCRIEEKKHIVALLAEGVDRNNRAMQNALSDQKSPSSRRAWIEINGCIAKDLVDTVALLAEGVDRNLTAEFLFDLGLTSPSSRRAWIEIPRMCGICGGR